VLIPSTADTPPSTPERPFDLWIGRPGR